MNSGNSNGRFGVRAIKQAANGKWRNIISALTSIDSAILEKGGNPCPICGGSDRFSVFDDFDETGGVHCRGCHNANSKPKSGDGISTVQWLTKCTFPEALQLIGQQVGIVPEDPENDVRDILADLCKQKRMPIESTKAFGASIAVRGRKRVVRFPVYDADGNPASYSDISPYATGKLNKGMLPKGGKAGLHLPDSKKPTEGETWLIVEGVKDAAALHSLGFKAVGLTGSALKQSFAQLFAGCTIVLVPDLDRPSIRGAIKSGEALIEVAAAVKVAILPGKIKTSQGDDVRDIIAKEGKDLVLQTIRDAKGFDADELRVNRPSVFISLKDDNEQAVADKVIRILSTRGFLTDDIENRIFQRANKLVVVAKSDSGPRIVPLDETGIRERITAAMDLIDRRELNGEEIEVLKRPPSWLVKAIYSRPHYSHVRKLDCIVTAPTLRRDGSIFQSEGYDSATKLLYLPDAEYPKIANSPSEDVVKRASAEILKIVSDFPFADLTAKSVWVALVLTLLGRSAVNGNVPLFAFTSNIRGSGKTKLCDLAGIIAHGRPMAKKTLPGKDEETRKVLTTIALESKLAVLLDNVGTTIGSTSLDAVLTCDFWTDRVLGKNESTGDLPWRTVMAVTGNNLAFQADTARRVVLCELHSDLESPEDRNDFQHANIEQFAFQNRARLAVASLTILRAFFAAGRPYKGKRLGSFESWSEIICGAMVFCGLSNPLDTVLMVRKRDSTNELLRLLLEGLAAVGGVDGLTSREILKGISDEPNEERQQWEPLRTAVAEITDKPTARKIGNTLKQFQGQVCGGRRLVRKDGRSNVSLWSVEKLRTNVDGVGIGSCHPFASSNNMARTFDSK